MATLKYVGTPANYDVQAGAGNDLVDQSYVNYLLSQNMSSTDVTNQIATQLAPFCLQSYATTLMSGLATPTWIQTQEQALQQATTIGQAYGPIPLGVQSGQVAKGLITAPSTGTPQTWPQPFWSPSTYNSMSMTATHDSPTELYTVAINYPNYTYVLACFGMVDVGVSANNGTQAEILVKVGSATGQTIAVGYGNAESYTGPGPGEVGAQMLSTAIAGQGPSWGSITGSHQWTPNNVSGDSSVVIGDYLQVPSSMTGTISASASFSGAYGGLQAGIGGVYYPTPVSYIEIVDLQGNQIVQSAGVGGASGTCTASYTGSLVAGKQYTVRGLQQGIGGGAFGFGAGSYGTWSSGATLTITPGTVPSASAANIIPFHLETQTPLTAATTLHVVLQSSDSTGNTPVSASTAFQGLWVMPLPWV